MTTASPVLTAELFAIPLEADRVLVYAPLRNAAFVGNAGLVDVLSDLGDGRSVEGSDPDGSLVALLREIGVVDGGPEARPSSVLTGPPRPTAVTLFLTTACNLRCTYCYAEAGDTPTEHMSLDVAKRGIDFVLANAHDLGSSSIEVNYHGGGEPTVNWTVLTGSFAYAQAVAAPLGVEVIGATASNGMLSDRQVDWVIANLRGGVSLSFDGLPEDQDRHRPTAQGRGSSNRVMRTMRRFDEAGYVYGVRMTVTHDQIPHLPESVEFICSRFRPKYLQVEPAYQLGRGRGAPSAETEAFIEGYRRAQSRAARHGMELSYSAARVGHVSNHFCGITLDSFALTPGGTVSACYEAFSESSAFAGVFHYGRPEGDGYVFDQAVLDNLRAQTVDQKPWCQGCFAKWNCSGDCYHKSLAAGSARFEGSERCHITRELVKDQLLARIAGSGGLVWYEPSGCGCRHDGA